MIMMQDKGVSKGVVKGPLYFFRRPDAAIRQCQVEDMDAEKMRLAQAQEKSIAQLEALAERCREEAGDEAAVLFETHAMFVEDEDYVECIHSCMEEENCNAEYAVQQAGEQFAEMFAAMDDAYMQARAADIRDVSNRICNNLMGIVEGGIDSAVPFILAADDLKRFSWIKARSLLSLHRVVPATAIQQFLPVPWVSLRFVVLGKH